MKITQNVKLTKDGTMQVEVQSGEDEYSNPEVRVVTTYAWEEEDSYREFFPNGEEG